MRFIFIIASFFITKICLSQEISITTAETNITQDFNSLVQNSTGTTLPNGWYFSETGTNANLTYTAGNGSSNAGDVWSYGPNLNSERALGGLRSGALNPTWGCKITNNTGQPIESITVSYTGEVWRIGNTLRQDRIDFSYSQNATSLITGTWTDVNQLDFSSNSSTIAPVSGSMLQSGNKSFTIFGLNLQSGSSIWFRFQDFDATGADDGIAIDNFTISASVLVSLPIELIKFESQNINNINLIEWSTATEHNSDYFIVERSCDGLNWETVGRINGSGYSTSVIDYQIADNEFKSGINYYRLIQYDFDGNFEIFGPISQNNFSEKPIKIYNSLGIEVDITTPGLIFLDYGSGKVVKTFN